MREHPRQSPLGNVAVTVRDPRSGAEWTVVEQDTSELPGSLGSRCLLFVSPSVIRRVWQFPPDWAELSAEELISLSWNV